MSTAASKARAEAETVYLEKRERLDDAESRLALEPDNAEFATEAESAERDVRLALERLERAKRVEARAREAELAEQRDGLEAQLDAAAERRSGLSRERDELVRRIVALEPQVVALVREIERSVEADQVEAQVERRILRQLGRQPSHSMPPALIPNIRYSVAIGIGEQRQRENRQNGPDAGYWLESTNIPLGGLERAAARSRAEAAE